MYDSEFYSELAKRIKAGTLQILDVETVRVTAGSLEFNCPTGSTYEEDTVIRLDGRPLKNVVRLVVIAEGPDPTLFVAMEIDPRVKAFE